MPLGRLVQERLGAQPDVLDAGDLCDTVDAGPDELPQREQHPPPVLHALPGSQAGLHELVQQAEERTPGLATHLAHERA
jgi:hypothetical protein